MTINFGYEYPAGADDANAPWNSINCEECGYEVDPLDGLDEYGVCQICLDDFADVDEYCEVET